MGATKPINVSNEALIDVMNSLNITEGFDVGLEMSGAPSTFKSMLKNMNHGEKIAMLGIFSIKLAISWDEVIFKGLIIKGVLGRKMFETWYKMSSLI